MVTLRRFLALLCLTSLSFAQHTPRKCADIPIWTTDNNKKIHVSQYAGKVVLIAMFLTSCDDCLATLQFLSRLQNEYTTRGLQVIAISLDESSANVVPYAQRYRFPFPMGHLDKDPAVKIADLKPDAHPIVPYILLVDWQGNVRFQYAGNDPVLQQGEKGIRGVVTGLLHQAADKTGPVYETRPAGKP